MISLMLVLLLCVFSIFPSLAFEDEFAVRGPEAMRTAALDTLLAERRATGSKDVFNDDSELMQKGRNYAISRFITKSEDALKISVSIIK